MTSNRSNKGRKHFKTEFRSVTLCSPPELRVSLVSGSVMSDACLVCVCEFPADSEVSTPQSQTEEMAREVVTLQPGPCPIRRSWKSRRDSEIQSVSKYIQTCQEVKLSGENLFTSNTTCTLSCCQRIRVRSQFV